MSWIWAPKFAGAIVETPSDGLLDPKLVVSDAGKVKMKQFETLVRNAMEFDGFMIEGGVAMLEFFLSDQIERGIEGNFIEFGVYKGRSASVFLNCMRESEKTFLVDSSEHPEIEKLAEISREFELIKGKSEQLIENCEMQAVKGPIRFSHHDASHTYINLSTELPFIYPLLADDAIVALDDFGTWAYPQMVAAAYNYLYTADHDLEIFLIADNKAFLCRKEYFSHYENLVLNKLLPHLKSRGQSYMLARTDDDEFRALALALKPSPDRPDRYGEHIWGDRYYKPVPAKS